MIDLSSYDLLNQEKQQLKLGLDKYFFDQNKHINEICSSLQENLADKLKFDVTRKNAEHCNLWVSTNIKTF